ncbi:MAG: VacB/RNase II family 3'-5' exoribonuclease [Acidobacteriota bacterium]|nr:VacB/RNase II family 3'-5' exoribonuclease [Acidobacteriota bacterium]
MISERELLEHIAGQPQQAAGYKQLVRELALRGRDRPELEHLLAELVVRGKLVLVARDRYAVASAAVNRNLVVGTLTMHRDGFGFVRPLDREVRERLDGDVFIPPFNVGEAMHGDQVLAELSPHSREGRYEGRIVRVMERAHATVVGTFHYGPRQNFVRPMDDRIKMDVIIPEGAEVVPAQSAHEAEDRVIGSEAGRRAWDDLEGLVVDCEITEWPTSSKNPRGRVVEVLGHEDDFGVDVEIIIRKHHLPHHFAPSAIAEAKAMKPELPEAELMRRRDFRELPIVTIDGETARDFDDAVLVRKTGAGYELQVHIADVAHYVHPGMDIDREAEIRGTSVYFPDRAIPMLPVELSTDLCSLRPQVDRLTMSCVMQMDGRGEIQSFELMPGVIRSARRMTYTAVQQVLDGDEAARTEYAPLVENFLLMQELAVILNEKRQRRGSIDFDLPEPLIEFDANGLMQGVTRSERLFANRLIEEFMLAANETVATYLEQKGVASLYRVHEPPDPKRVYEFENLAAAFGYSLGIGALPVARFRMKPDHRPANARSTAHRSKPQDVELPQEVSITPTMYQKLADKIAGKPEERILSYLMLRSLRQARYSEINDGHFALAATCYTHFTSPIRRYPDLLVHRILKAVLVEAPEHVEGKLAIGQGGHVEQKAEKLWSAMAAAKPETKKKRAPAEIASPIPEDTLHHQAEDASFAERRADQAERELVEWKKTKFMADRVGEDFDGLIVSITKYGIFVELTELFVEGLIPLNSMFDDRYTFHENTRQIIGQRTRRTFSLGDRLRVVLDRIDPVERKLQFSIFEEHPAPRRREKKRRHY